MAATLGIVITADNKQALEGLQQTTNATTQLSNSFSRVPNATNQANQALINTGRVFQDLNYGFVGIANNLNPLLESFQRLGESAKVAGTSIGKELLSSLSGPAGIGVAISLATFAFLKFGDEISAFVNEKALGLNTAMNLQNKVFNDSSEAYESAELKIQKLSHAFELYTNGIITKDLFLKQFNSTLGDTIAKTNDLATAEKFLIDHSEEYVKMLYYKAVAQEAAKQAAKREVERLKLEEAPAAPTFGETLQGFVSRGGTSGADIAEKNRKNRIKDLEYDAYILKDISEKYTTFSENIQANLARIFGPADISKGAAKDPLAEATKDYQDSNKRNQTLFDENLQSQKQYFIESEKIWQEYVNKLKGINTTAAINILKGLTPKEILKDETYDADLEQKARGISSFSKSQLYVTDILAPLGTKDPEGSVNKKKINTTKNEMTDFLKATEDGFKKAHDAANSFASDMSSNITSSLQNAFQAVKQGENVFQALSDSVLQFAEDLLFAIIRAELFAAIQGAIAVSSGGVAGAAAGGTGFFDILMSLLGGGKKYATGGIATTPHLGMVGEAGPEAIIPLSKLSGMLNTTFSAGAMSGGGGMSGGSFVLRGQDLLVAINRTQKSSFLKGQNISLV